MFAAKFPISQNPHGILYVYYTIIFLFLHFFCGIFIYIGSHLALEKKAEKNIVKNLHVSKMCSTFALAIER